MSDRGFRVILIKPSHYDDDGYVIQWRRSTIPSNSLASVYGLIAECAEARVLGPEVEIAIEAYDECNTVIDVAAAVARIRATGGGFVGLVGVQSNQYPRALDLGRQFRQAGVAVVMGGFHVSGCLSMLSKMPPELVEARDLGITLFAGEAEGGRMADLLRDLDRGAVQPVYNFLNDLPDLDSATFPILPPAIVSRVVGHYTELRCRTRLSIPVQFLHDHQRPGPQIALSQRRRRRGDRARQQRARHHAFLRYRR